MNLYYNAAQLILQSQSTVILTGAGLSTESGIPDFRSPGSGLWEAVDPMEALSTEVLFNRPHTFYRTGFQILLTMKDAQPNKAHHIITEMERKGLIDLVITQNIDNLHQKAGTQKVYEVHGNTRTCTCIDCKKDYTLNGVQEKVNRGEIPPKCTCGGILRPDVVLFGDMLPECFYQGVQKVENADLLIVLGSSLTVSPVNYLAAICKKLIIINLGETAFDHRTDIKIKENISDALAKIMTYIKE